MHHRFDWLGRFDDSTEPLPNRPVRRGEIAIKDLSTGTLWRSIEGFRLLCRTIPAYWLLLPFTYVPFVRRRIEAEMGVDCADARETPAGNDP
jgi:hypothetical protein